MALWIRNLSIFNVNLEWYGRDEIEVKGLDGEFVEVVKTSNGSNDPAAIGRLMKDVEEEMHRVACAFE
jgi:hypothetical protein